MDVLYHERSIITCPFVDASSHELACQATIISVVDLFSAYAAIPNSFSLGHQVFLQPIALHPVAVGARQLQVLDSATNRMAWIRVRGQKYCVCLVFYHDHLYIGSVLLVQGEQPVL